MLWILTAVCCVTIFLGLVLNINGGPLNSIAGFIFVPMQQGINNTGSWIFNTANDFRTLSDVLEENEKLKAQVDELKRLEVKKIPEDIDYKAITNLRLEAIEKLEKIRPENVGQASRISGVSPADISVLLIHLRSN